MGPCVALAARSAAAAASGSGHAPNPARAVPPQTLTQAQTSRLYTEQLVFLERYALDAFSARRAE